MHDLSTEYVGISEVLYNHLPEAAPRQIKLSSAFYSMQNERSNESKQYSTANTFYQPSYLPLHYRNSLWNIGKFSPKR